MRLGDPSAHETVVQKRARLLFDLEYERIARRGDRMFITLLILQWFAALAVSQWLSPLSWAGTDYTTHQHVWAAVLLGALITLFPIAVARSFPGRRPARLTMACAQMLWSALLIHLTGGRIETHFHIFGSLAFLAFYRDPVILLPATLIVAADHVVRGAIWPESIYGELNPEWWRFVEHAGWVLFIDIFLIRNCYQSHEDLRSLTRRQAQLEYDEQTLEERVERRTAALMEERTKVSELNEQLKTRMLRFRALFKHSPIGIVLLDREGRFLEWNDAFRRIIERCELSPFVSHMEHLVAEPDRAAFLRLLAHVKDEARTEIATEIRFGAHSQAVTECLLAASAPGGEPDAQYFALVRDVTEERQAAAGYEAMRVERVQAQKLESIGQLASGIAHEINTPTQYITDNVGFLQKAFGSILEALDSCAACVTQAKAGKIEPRAVQEASTKLRRAKLEFVRAEIPKAIEQSIDGLARVTSIVRAMKEFSHPSQGTKAPVNLNEAIATTLTVTRNEWKYVADVETDFDQDLPPVPCMRDEFNQVILNVIVNAAHAISDVVDGGAGGRGAIKISTRLRDNRAEIRISDNGVGIPEAVRGRIFEPFFTTKQVGKGTGQGLAIARSVVVDKHQGTIDVESELGEGTTFIIRLPLATAEQHAA